MAEDRITIEVRAEGAERAADAVDNVRASTEAAADSMERARSAASDWGNIMSGLNAASDMLGRIANGAQSFAMGALEARANTEAWEHQLAAIMGSAGAAKDELEKLKEMANTTVAIDTEGAIKGSATFQRMGYSADEARSKIESLANATALYGGGAEEIKNALRQIEQLNSRTSGFSQDIIAIQNAIPGVGQMIKEHFNVENFEALSDAGIQGKEVVAAMFEEMSKLEKVDGGIGETMEQIRAAQQDIASGMGEALAPALTLVASCVSGLGKAISELPDWGKGIMAWTVAIGGLVAGLGLAVTTTGQLVTSWKALTEVGKTIRDVFMKTTVAKTADTAAEAANTAATKAGTITRKWDIKAMGQQIAKTWALVTAKIAELALSGPKGWIALAGGVAAIGLGIGAIANMREKSKQKDIEDESAEQAKEWREKKAQKKAQAEAAASNAAAASTQKSAAGSVASNQKVSDSAEKRADAVKKSLEEEKKAEEKRFQEKSELTYLETLQRGEILLARRIKLEQELNSVMRDSAASEDAKSIAAAKYQMQLRELLNLEAKENSNLNASYLKYKGDAGSLAKAKSLQLASAFEQAKNDPNKSIKEKWTAFWDWQKSMADSWSEQASKSISKYKDKLDGLLDKRTSFTDKVIDEIKRERSAQDDQYYEMGQMAVLTSGGPASEEEAAYTPEETLRAVQAVNKKEQFNKMQRQRVDSVLYGGNTEVIKNQVDKIDELLGFLRESGASGKTQADSLTNIAKYLAQLLRYATADARAFMS